VFDGRGKWEHRTNGLLMSGIDVVLFGTFGIYKKHDCLHGSFFREEGRL